MIRRLFTAPILINRCVIRAPVNYGNMVICRHHTQKITKDVNAELSEIRNDLRCLTEKMDINKTSTDKAYASAASVFLMVFTSLLTCTIILKI